MQPMQPMPADASRCDAERRTQNAGCAAADAMQNAECRMQNAGCDAADAGCSRCDAGEPMQNAVFRFRFHQRKNGTPIESARRFRFSFFAFTIRPTHHRTIHDSHQRRAILLVTP